MTEVRAMKPKSKTVRRSLAEYAASRPDPRSTPCFICGIPQAPEVNEGYRGGTKQTVIFEWLANDCGYGDKVSINKLNRHFRAGHHEPQK